MGSGKRAQKEMNTTIESNLFVRIKAEQEIISIKASRILIRDNTLRNCYYAIVLRDSNDTVVEGNYFFASEELPCGGVRLHGDRHQILYNHFKGVSSGIQLGAGHPASALEQDCQNGYRAAHHAIVKGNRFTDVVDMITTDYRLCENRPDGCMISEKCRSVTIEDNGGPAEMAGAYEASHPCIGPNW